MAINTKDFATIVRETVTGIQAASSRLLDLTIGSILRAVAEANAALVLWLQGLIVQLLALTRAATAMGTDLDSWMADYGVTRLAAVAASGQVTFARFTATLQALIPIGAKVQTSDGAQKFSVVIDTAHANYSAALGGYVLSAGVASLAVPVKADVAGAGGNALAGAINTLSSAIVGVDTVSNAATLINGLDAESDAALRARFVDYIASLSKATTAAAAYALSSIKQGTQYTLVENAQYNGTADLGYFYVVVDDGSGAPTSEFLASAANAIDAVRPVGSRYGVFAPVVVTATVQMTVSVAAGYAAAATKTAVQGAVRDYINALPLGVSLNYTRLAQLAYDASAGVQNVSGVTLNGATADLAATNNQAIKAGTVTVL